MDSLDIFDLAAVAFVGFSVGVLATLFLVQWQLKKSHRLALKMLGLEIED